MDDETLAHDVAGRYLRFAHVEAAVRSPRYAQWAEGIARDPDLLARIGALPPVKQQANLVFASMRWAGVPTAPWPEVRDLVLEMWDDVDACIRTRSTQTNEPRRLATLLPAFASLPQPLAIIEVGASMGLCLQPRRWSYDVGERRVLGDPGLPRLATRLEGAAPVLPEIAWSAGLDLHPLDPRNADDVRWLEALIWPVGDGVPDAQRLARLHAAVEIAVTHGPRVEPGDLLVDTAALVERAAAEAATTVVFHSAVLAYLAADDRDAFAATMRESPAVWIANEGIGIVRGARAPGDAATGDFVISIDEVPFALADPHCSWVRPLAR